MGDLISRKVVMEYLQEQQANVIIERQKHGFVSQEVCDGMKSSIDAFINFIVQCPTAYNMENVVKQLEEKSNDIPIQYENNYEQGYTNGIDYAIDVVKNGENI